MVRRTLHPSPASSKTARAAAEARDEGAQLLAGEQLADAGRLFGGQPAGAAVDDYFELTLHYGVIPQEMSPPTEMSGRMPSALPCSES